MSKIKRFSIMQDFMTMKVEVKESENGPWINYSDHESTISDLNSRIAELEKEMEWISVETRLPEHNQQVWTYFGDTAFGIWDEPRQAFFEGPNKYNEKVTHWLPMPIEPK